MRIKKDFVLRDVFGEPMVFSTGLRNNTEPVTIKLNKSSAVLWKCLEKGADEKKLTDTLLNEYEIDSATAQNAVNAFLDELKEADCID